jgi:cysteinyl-tRNA synthetase
MELRLYNTLTRQKEPFRPLDPARVRMYVCGPTVYDRAHIGNARPVIMFDVLFRLLRYLYGPEHVTYVRNITDVDDKINARAAERGVPIRALTQETYKWFKEDVEALGCLPPTAEPRATEYVEPMKELIERLVMAECAYVAEDHVLFHVAAMSDYGKLSHRSLDDMIAGARVEVAPYKKDPMDFVLWKPSKAGEPAWPSPAGIKTPGRPGWHIECSAMSWKHLGETFDIHGGGIDLVFPHHENELAQSRCAFGTKMMAQVWMHNGFVQMEGEKMAKSEGNVITIHQVLSDWAGYAWPGEAIRLNMLRTHYRQPIDWTPTSLDESHKTLWDWYDDCKDADKNENIPETVRGALCDDLNTPAAITAMHSLRRKGDLSALASSLSFLGFSCDKAQLSRRLVAFIPNQSQDAANVAIAARGTRRVIDTNQPFPFGSPTSGHELDESLVDQMVEQRDEARKVKNFKEADRLRDELTKMGVVLHDTKDGKTTWKVAR